MKRIIVISLLLFGSFNVDAQFESVLNNTNKYWNIYNFRFTLGIDIFSDSMYLGNNVIINNTPYRELYSLSRNFFFITPEPYGFLREDTVSGKLWILLDSTNLTTENLVYDLSLVKNDTFRVFHPSGFGLPPDQLIVDTTYINNGRKKH